MSLSPIYQQTIALGALFQALQQVRNLANHGQHDPLILETAIFSIYQIDAPDVLSIFGGRGKVGSGLRTLEQQLGGGGGKSRDLSITSYAGALMSLERRLMSNANAQQALQQGILRVKSENTEQDIINETAIGDLSALYQSVISPLGSRIIVQGQAENLRNEHNANRIRVFLLAALRAVVLWRQVGGKQLTLILKRGKLLNTIKDLTKIN